MRGEREAIQRIAALAGALPSPQVGIGDDAAVVAAPGAGPLLLAADVVVSGVHVDLRYCSPADVGWKALAVNVSDIAAMGGVPLHALVSIVHAPGVDLDGVFTGLVEAGRCFGCTVVGGDLSDGRELVVSVAVTGRVPGGRPVLRSGARAGDVLFVTGPLGGSAAGMALLRQDAGAGGPLTRAHRRPRARVREGVAAAAAGASAMIDVSDGLAADLDHLATASGVGVALDEVPIAGGATLEQALSGGEDYELTFAAPAPALARVAGAFAAAGLRPPVVVGRCVEDPGARLLRGLPFPVGGFQHRLA